MLQHIQITRELEKHHNKVLFFLIQSQSGDLIFSPVFLLFVPSIGIVRHALSYSRSWCSC